MRKPGLVVSLLEDRSLPAPVASLWIGDRVWNDRNVDGIQQADEPGVPGVVLRLYRGEVLVGTTVSREDGSYTFDRTNVLNSPADRLDDGLEPNTTYQVRIDPMQDALLWLSPTHANRGPARTGDSDGVLVNNRVIANVTTGAAGGNADVDFGFSTSYSIGNLIWNDRNNNGRRDPGEPGLAGVTVRLLDATGTIELGRTTTTSTGAYNFGNVVRGQYLVEIGVDNFAAGQPLANLSSSTGNPGSDGLAPFEGPASVALPIQDSYDNGSTLPNGAVRSRLVTVEASNRGVDFGFFSAGKLSGRLFSDTNGNGQLDAGETTGPAGARVRASGPMGTFYAITSSNGSYNFANLPTGRYTVSPVGRINGYNQFAPQRTIVSVSPTVGNLVANFAGKAVADVRLGISSNSSFVALNDEVVFTLQVRNLSGTTASNLRVDLKPGTGLLVVGTVVGDTQGSIANNVWTIGDLAAGQRATIQVRARVVGLNDICLGGTAIGSTPDANALDNRATARLIPWAASLDGSTF